MPAESQITDTEYQNRIDIVKGLIIKCLPQRDIVKYCLKEHGDWNVTDRQLRNYVYAAHKQLHVAASQIDWAKELVLAKAQWEYSMMLSLKISDVKSFQTGIKGKTELLNLKNLRYEPEWKADARAAGYDPEQLLDNLFGNGEFDITIMDEMISQETRDSDE